MPSASCRTVYCCLLALMLVIVRTADAHAHLCNDGKEPPVSIHLGDGGSHHCQTDASSGHTGDKDVPIAADVVFKKAPHTDPWAAALPVYAFDVVAPAVCERVEARSHDARIESAAYLRPPLRGPPA